MELVSLLRVKTESVSEAAEWGGDRSIKIFMAKEKSPITDTFGHSSVIELQKTFFFSLDLEKCAALFVGKTLIAAV